jgi:hypothetical protein
MSIFPLNGVDDESESPHRLEIAKEFLRERRGDLSQTVRQDLEAAINADVEGDLGSAERNYRKVLRAVGRSAVVTARLKSIRRRKGHNG